MLVVGFVYGEEDGTGLHHEDAWSEPAVDLGQYCDRRFRNNLGKQTT